MDRRVEVGRRNEASRLGTDGRTRRALDSPRGRTGRHAVDSSCLACGAGGVVVLVVARRATRLHVNGRGSLPTLGQWREGGRELRRHRQNGENGEEPATASGWGCAEHQITVRVSLPKR